MFSSTPTAAAASTMSSSSSIPTRQFQQPQPHQEQQQQRSKRIILNIAVYLLMACSTTILLFHSYQLQSHRFEAFINNSVLTKTAVRRVLPVDEDEQQNENETNEDTNNNNNSNNEDFNKGGFYVPSLDYRIKGISQYNTQDGMNFQAHVYCEEFEKGLKWDWWQPSQLQSSGEDTNEDSRDEKQQHQQQQRLLRKEEVEDQLTITTKRTGTGTRKRLLIGLSSGYNDNAKFLERAVWSARVYGAIWSRNNNNNNHDNDDVTVVTLQGTAFSPHGCKAPSSYSSIDKIRLLFKALDVKSPQIYDQLLILDADTMMYDMDVDVTALSGNGNGNGNDIDNNNDDDDDFVVAGAPILNENGKKEKLPWMIGSSMMLWNLQHPLTPTVALDWFNYAKNAIIRGTYLSDQKYLHKSLQKHCTDHENDKFTIVRPLSHHKFGDDTRGKIIKQFIPHTNNNNTTDVVDVNVNDKKQIDTRLARMEETAKRICSRHPNACDEVGEPPRYETSY
jgi:hypothetical protein